MVGGPGFVPMALMTMLMMPVAFQNIPRGTSTRSWVSLATFPGDWNSLSSVPSRDLPSHGGGTLGFGRQAQPRSRHRNVGGKPHRTLQNQSFQLDRREPNSKKRAVPVAVCFLTFIFSGLLCLWRGRISQMALECRSEA